MMRSYLIKAVGYLIAFLVGFLSHHLTQTYFKALQTNNAPQVVQTTTIDTIIVYKPKETKIREIKTETIKVVIRDTLLRIDTLYLPREQRVYEDSLYRAVVSGYEPRLDSISIYRPTITTTITKIATKKEWRKFSYGLQAGVGVVRPFQASNASVGWYIGLGIGYSF